MAFIACRQSVIPIITSEAPAPVSGSTGKVFLVSSLAGTIILAVETLLKQCFKIVHKKWLQITAFHPGDDSSQSELCFNYHEVHEPCNHNDKQQIDPSNKIRLSAVHPVKYNNNKKKKTSNQYLVKLAFATAAGATERMTVSLSQSLGTRAKGGTRAKWRAPNHSPPPWGSVTISAPLSTSCSPPPLREFFSDKRMHDDY